MASNGGTSPEQTGSHAGAAPASAVAPRGMVAVRAGKAKRKGGGERVRHAHQAKKGKKTENVLRPAEKLEKFPKANLLYDGEQAERRTVVRWFFRAMGAPAKEDWTSGQYGTSVEIANRMGLDATCARNIRSVMGDVVDGIDVREPPAREGSIKMSPGDCAVARDCLSSGFALGQATANVVAHRLKKLQLQIQNGLLELEGSAESIRDQLEAQASVSKETVRATAHREDGDVHRRQTKKSGTIDTSANWSIASLAQVNQQLEQLKAGLGDTMAIRNCRAEGWNPWELAQVAWWDERHRKVCLGCLSSYEWRFPVDPNNPDCFLPICEGGMLPKEMPRTSAKYLSEARKSLGVMMKEGHDGVMVGRRFVPFNYTSRKIISYTKYLNKVEPPRAHAARQPSQCRPRARLDLARCTDL